MSKKSKKKVFFMKKRKTSTAGTKLGRVKGFLRNPYVEAIGTGFLGAATYVITTKVLTRETKTSVEEKKTTVDICGDVDVVEYTFHNYDKDIYVSAKVRQALEVEELKRLKKIDDLDELLSELKQLDLVYLYVG